MRKIQVILISLLILIRIGTLSCYSDEKILDVPLYAQQTNMWCWAASGEMIMNYLDPAKDVAQCTQANDYFHLTNCCESFKNCVKGGWPQYDNYGFDYSSTGDGQALSWEQLVAQINSNRPVGFAWHWTGSGGHYMVVKGWEIIDDTNYVHVNDPWPWNPDKTKGGNSHYIVTYDYYVKGSDHTHWRDDFNITRVSTRENNSNKRGKK
jgi:hypothetical protein